MHRYHKKLWIIWYVCHLSSVICHLSPVICHLSPDTCHLSPVICHLSIMTYHLSCLAYFLSIVNEDCVTVETSRCYETTVKEDLWTKITRPWHKLIHTYKDFVAYRLNWPRERFSEIIYFFGLTVNEMENGGLQLGGICLFVSLQTNFQWASSLILYIWISWQAI